MPTQHHPQRPAAHRAGWAEYLRLIEAGVDEHTAQVLAQLQQPADDERAYWRQLWAGVPTTAAARAAHARAQAARRRESRAA